jgi:hypothetical protein
MALGDPYYHGIIRKTIVAFGELFSDVRIERKDSVGVTQQLVRVPIGYGPKEKWLRRVQENPDLQKSVKITVPRMAFEITGYQYDPSRRMSSGYVSTEGHDKVNTPVPYTLTINLYVITRTQEDSLNILEQILPYFAPNIDLSIVVLDDPKLTSSFPVSLSTVSQNDNYDTDLDDNRMIINTLSFTAKINLYGPMIKPKVIKTSIANINTGALVYTAAVNPQEATVADTYTILDNWEIGA